MDKDSILKEIENLTEEEKEVYDSCIEYEFEPLMILEAIHKCGSNDDAVAEWCFNPANKKMFENTSKGEYSNPELSEAQVDTSNATVQELIDLKFPEDLCIEAVKQYGEDFEQCMEYCTNQAESDSGSISDTDRDDESISLEPVAMLCSDVDVSDTDDSCLSM